MIQKCENCKENGKILIKNARKSKFRKTCLSKYSCQENVKLLGPRHVIPTCCQINFKFGGVCFNIKKVINVRSQRGHFLSFFRYSRTVEPHTLSPWTRVAEKIALTRELRKYACHQAKKPLSSPERPV